MSERAYYRCRKCQKAISEHHCDLVGCPWCRECASRA